MPENEINRLLDVEATDHDAVAAKAIEYGLSTGSVAHPNLATHDAMGLATDAELDDHITVEPDPHPIYALDTDLDVHIAASDPHAGYQRESEKGQASGYASLDGSATVPDAQIASTIARDAEVTSAVSGAVTTHEAASDPHTGYQRESEKGQANGYASLDGSTTIPDAQIPATITRDAEVTSAINTHEGAVDPHSVYAKDADVQATDFLVGSASSYLSGEIVVGTSPGGELGNTWASPTVDASHSGSTHAATQAAAEATAAAANTADIATHAGLADPHTGYRLESADHTHASTGLQGGVISSAGPDADITVDTAGAAGTAGTQARSGHGHKVSTSASAAAAIGTAAAGTSGHSPSRDDHVHATGAGTPTTSAVGDAAAIGAGPAAAMTNHVHGRESFGASAAAVGTSSAGAATTPSRSDHVHATGAGTPSTQAFGDAAATGSGPAAAMTDHKHAMPALGTTAQAVGTSAGGSATTPSKSDHVHATGAGTPSTQAFGDAAAVGTGPAAAMTDHKHAMMADPTTAHVAAGDPHTQYALDTDLSTHAAAADPHTGYLKESNTIDFLVGTATSELAGEIVVGATPGGELGGTWPSPTVDTTHAGTAHPDILAPTRIITGSGETLKTAGPGDRGPGQVVTGVINAVGSVIVGVPKTPRSSFTVPAGYVHRVDGSITTGPNVQMTTEGSATLETANFNSTSRLYTPGRG